MTPTIYHTLRLFPDYFDMDETVPTVNESAIWSIVKLVAYVFARKYWLSRQFKLVLELQSWGVSLF